jgi:hypothetical protein
VASVGSCLGHIRTARTTFQKKLGPAMEYNDVALLPVDNVHCVGFMRKHFFLQASEALKLFIDLPDVAKKNSDHHSDWQYTTGAHGVLRHAGNKWHTHSFAGNAI